VKDLIERIKELRKEIKVLKYERNGIQKQIDQKEDVLEELEKLTVNQIDMFENE
jgi:chaperonin cofactor prefoldin